MIKRIQLRGISHQPSDRMTQDGGVEECIDLRLEDQEHGPAKAPEDVTDTLAPGLSASGISVLYIHKTNAYTNYVGYNGTKLSAYVRVSGNTWDTVDIRNLTGSVGAVTSIGNMLVYTLSDGKTYYALYKDGAYTDLGSEIPRPEVLFFNNPGTAPESEVKVHSGYVVLNAYFEDHSTEGGTPPAPTPSEFWNYAKSKKLSLDEAGQAADTLYRSVYDGLWAYVNATRADLREQKMFSAPVLARYAVRLSDKSYIHLSEPIMLSAGVQSHVRDVKANIEFVAGTLKTVYASSTPFDVHVQMTLNDAESWKDLIESVDIFISTDILVPKMNADLSRAEQTNTKIDEDYYYNDALIHFSGADEDSTTTFETAMLEKVNFYKIASYKIDELPTDDPLKPMEQDELVVQARLPEAEPHTILPTGTIGAYNERLVSGAQTVTLSPGHNAPHADVLAGSGATRYYAIFYHVRDANGAERIVQGYRVDGTNSAFIRAYVSYPDPKCFQADLYYGATENYTTVVTLPMKEHPRLNCSYGFWGLDKQLDTPELGDGRSSDVAGTPPTADPTYDINNRLALSEMDNPFVFPLGQRERFTARILQVVPATIALSANQSGPFPLYIFTEDGIWAESVNAEGGLSNKLVVSRDVAVEGTITQLDRAIVFVSGQGVMYLNGMQVSCLSPYMNGPQWTIADFVQSGSSLRTALTRDGFGPLLDISVDTTDFQNFVQGCKPLYDYGNKRILFFNGDEDYGYEYVLDTQTWHKVSVPAAFVRTLNGYPQAYAVFGGAIYEWSVRHDYNAADPVRRKGWLLTRPFDLGEPDVRKAIRSIRVRGRFHRNDVRYLLFGSFDDIHWQRLTSLRGGSYKTFRILLLTDLSPEEKVSWIDVDYESRFQTKLR